MLQTGIPVDVWADQGWRVIDTALDMLDNTAERGKRSTWAQG